MIPNAPEAAKPCSALAARKAKFEAERARLFPTWKAELEAAKGNVTEAGANHEPQLTRNQANKLTVRLGLVEYAQELRIAAVGRARGTSNRKRTRLS